MGVGDVFTREYRDAGTESGVLECDGESVEFEQWLKPLISLCKRLCGRQDRRLALEAAMFAQASAFEWPAIKARMGSGSKVVGI
jgi:hypothetical protein